MCTRVEGRWREALLDAPCFRFEPTLAFPPAAGSEGSNASAFFFPIVSHNRTWNKIIFSVFRPFDLLKICGVVASLRFVAAFFRVE